MSKDMPDNELLDNINKSMAMLPTESANEIALLLLFTEYAALSHPSLSCSKIKIEEITRLQKRITEVINDLSKQERQPFSAHSWYPNDKIYVRRILKKFSPIRIA